MRPRKKKYQQLPRYVYVNRGRYIYRPTGERDIVIGKDSMPLADVWQAWRTLSGERTDTLKWLVDEYRQTPRFRALKTHRAISAALDRLLATRTKTGTFGQVPYQSITVGVMQRYLDKRDCVAGNREVAYLSSAFRWAITQDLVSKNPCKGVYRKQESPRDRYVTDEEYQAIYDRADPVVQVAMELAYLCRMRINEVLDTRVKDIEDAGLNTRRSKGSNSALTLWGDRLRKAVEAGLTGCVRVPDMPIVNIHGSPIDYDRFHKRWLKTGATFHFHDIKAKGVSDFEGDKKAASGHKSERMVDVYSRSRIVVEPTK